MPPRKPQRRRPGSGASRRPTPFARFGCASRRARLGGGLAAALGISAAFASPAHAQDQGVVTLADPALPDPAADPATVDGAADGGGVADPMPVPLTISSGDRFTLSVGGSAWRGDFGATTDSDIAAVVVNGRIRAGALRLDATLPWMSIRSDRAIFTGIDATPLIVGQGLGAGRTLRQGLGDLTLGANVLALNQDDLGVDVELSGRVKLPTAADSTNLSTGKVDYAVGAEVSRTFGTVTPSVKAGYRIFGDPDGFDLRNSFTSSVGVSFVVFRSTVALVSYDFAERASDFIQNAHEAVFGISTPLSDRIRLNTFGSAGLSSGAADFSAGLSLTVGFGRRT